MKNNTIIIGLIIFLLLFFGIQQYIIWTSTPNEDIVLKEIVKLESKIETLSKKQDELKKSILKTEDSIAINEKQHEEIANYIIVNNDSANRIFIDNYIKNYLERYYK